MKKIAVVLSGCGYLDGAEIRESVFSLLALDTYGADIEIFAPDNKQHHVVNHLKGEEDTGSRNILEEAGRIARGKVSPLKDLNPENFDGLVIPGGFGVAKNLSSFAFEGATFTVKDDFQNIIKSFNNASKPIAAICIAPVVMAKVLGEKGPTLTIGNDSGVAGVIEELGGIHQNCAANEICIDKNLKIFTTPAYMFDDAKISDIYAGINSCIKEMLNNA